ncbi:hypothetical protein LJY25_08110 [Hymenobacter sp. BT175]|uniref:hypothetical protein n=1 Tax=Hymenobacter translucens TaxID=2886507 RepID=UPI001D0E4CF0|nr:hypothetical protein [Hymenobacter translucens]MCC2546405.1 hypothetical protein [Hymenobacter translucens]
MAEGTNYQADFRRIIDEELGEYSTHVLELLAAALQARGLVLSAELLKSLQTTVLATSVEQIAQMGVEFEQYGRIREMKNLGRTKAPPIEEMEAYVKKVGITNFPYVPGYGFKSRPLGNARTINRIAWGLARAKMRDGGQVRPKAWFAKNFYKSINRFIDAVATRYAAQTGTHIAGSIKF